MTRPIDPARLRELRKRKKLSQQELAKRAKLTKGSLHRLEAGKQPGSRQRTRDGLAKALGVEAGVLTGETPLPPAELAGAAEPEAPESQMNLRVNAAVRNAYWLASKSYGLPMTRIVELAPFLFVCAAEASLERRRAKVAELEAVLDRQEALAGALPHLANQIGPASRAWDALRAEKASIAKRDLLAADFPDDLSARSDLKGLHDADVGAYESWGQNPFIRHLQEAGPSDSRVAEIDWLDRSSVICTVCHADAIALACGDEDLAGHIVAGFVALHEMPRELLSGEASDRRVGWLREKSPAGDISDEELMQYYPPDEEELAP